MGRKRFAGALLGVAMAASGWSAPPAAHAASGPYTIVAGVPVVSVVGYAFAVAPAGSGVASLLGPVWDRVGGAPARVPVQSCDDVANSPLNGIDARVIDVRSYAGKVVTVRWSAVAVTPVVGSVDVTFYDAACNRIPQVTGQGRSAGDIVQSVPQNAKWILVTATFSGVVTFTLLP